MTQAEFKFRRGNPDVLTSIANLSNDEVFTPPDFANRMLDTLEEAWASSNSGASIWEDSSVTFLDPFTKSGVFLREITQRLTHGLSNEIPDLQERVNHILTKQVFGIGITQLTALLARRSVYCSKLANGEHSIATAFDNQDGNIWFERTEHVWVGGKNKLLITNGIGEEQTVTTDGKCKYCGASQKEFQRDSTLESHAYAFIHGDSVHEQLERIFGAKMKFDVVIGNPPYQLSQSGADSVGGAALPVYQKFIESAKQLEPLFISMVTPSRWFAGGRGLDEFRAKMLSDRKVRELVDFPDSTSVFPGTQIKGGVSYFLWEHSWSGECLVRTVLSDGTSQEVLSRKLDQFDVFVRWNSAIPILEKILSVSALNGWNELSESVSPIRPFGLRTNYRGKSTPAGMERPIQLAENGSISFVEYEDILKNHKWVDSWKVLLGRAYGAGDGYPHQIYNYPIILPPESACTETYLIIGQFESKSEAENFSKFLQTKLVRFLVSLRKNTQDIYNDRFKFVPNMPMSRSWSDVELFELFKISKSEIAFIDSMIRPMGESDE